jgi:2-desacetyl-2-hydroxyethyl bacteriochlorophyllide A dehydrogenase
VDQAVIEERSERLANRAATHAQVPREVDFGWQPLTRLVHTIPYVVAHPGSDTDVQWFGHGVSAVHTGSGSATLRLPAYGVKNMAPVALALTAPRRVELIDEPSLRPGAGFVRVRTLYSGVSSGTELAFYRGTNPYLHKRWDPTLRLFTPGSDGGAVQYPLLNWGYEEVGEVIEAGLGTDVALGTRVYGTWGHRAEHVIRAVDARARVLPAEVDPLVGTFSHIGPVTLNGVLDAQPRLGETVAVFGLGTVGQLVAQLARHAGARVIGVDLLPSRRSIAERLGTELLIDAERGGVAEQIKALTDGRGADVCIEASGSSRALHEAIRACAYGSRVVALGFLQGEATGLLLGEEFHHNRVQLVCSQIGGVASELQHRWDRARLVRTFMQLAMSGAIRCTELITHRVPIAEAARLFNMLDEEPQSVLQAVLDFGDAG